jgi:hypothetical protein
VQAYWTPAQLAFLLHGLLLLVSFIKITLRPSLALFLLNFLFSRKKMSLRHRHSFKRKCPPFALNDFFFPESFYRKIDLHQQAAGDGINC